MTEFTQYKIFLMGSSLAFSLKEDPVRCAKVCGKSWVILVSVVRGTDSLMNVETFKGDLKHAKSSVLENRYSTEGQAKS